MNKHKEHHHIIHPIEGEVKSLLDMFEFFLTERQLGKPIDSLGEAVKDIRIIIGRILVDYFLKLNEHEEEKFVSALAAMLADRCTGLPFDSDEDKAYQDYCVEQVLIAFEYADEVKRSYPEDHVLQKILALDIPILRPFDYGLQGKLKVLEKHKRRSFHGKNGQ
jgi:hypothetical protein